MNVVFIMNDTWRYDYVGANGNDWIHTPVLDQFAAESAVFDRSYIGSFATIPTRHDLMKGRFGEPLHRWQPLQWDALTMPEVLRENGVVTMLINDTPHMINYGYGFDRPFHSWEMIRGNEVDRSRTDWFPAWRIEDAEKFRTNSHMATYHRQTMNRSLEEEYFAPLVMKATCDWLERNVGHDQFFLWVDSFDPHEPWDPPQHYVDMYAPDFTGTSVYWPRYGRSAEFLTEEEQIHIRNLFAAECTMCDAHIGRVLEKIDNLGMRDNTVVIIMSDHGHYFGEHGLQSKTGPLYEEVSHQILMVRHPDGIGAGERIQSLVQSPDVAVTIMDMFGITPPKQMDVQGHSLLPLMTGKLDSVRNTAVSGGYPFFVPETGSDNNQGIFMNKGWTSLTATGPEWSLIDFPDRDLWELYYLPDDVGMTRNLIEDNPGEAERLHGHVIQFLEGNKAPNWMQNLWKNGPVGVEPPARDKFLELVRKKGMPHATPLDGSIL